MFRLSFDHCRKPLALLAMIALGLAFPLPSLAAKKKKTAPDAETKPATPAKPAIDPKKLVWPSPPSLPRIQWLDYYAGERIDHTEQAVQKQKTSWMDRLAGTQSQAEKAASIKLPYQLLSPYGIAEDSKGQVYIADNKVGAIFIFNPENHDTQFIRNGAEAHFVLLNCLAMDDDDRLFVSDGELHHVLVFNAKHELEAAINEGMKDP